MLLDRKLAMKLNKGMSEVNRISEALDEQSVLSEAPRFGSYMKQD